jgi:hypothetical protein
MHTVDGRLHVDPVERAECKLSIRAVSTLAYGVNDPGDFAIRQWGDSSVTVQAVMRQMFSRQVLYRHEMFLAHASGGFSGRAVVRCMAGFFCQGQHLAI